MKIKKLNNSLKENYVEDESKSIKESNIKNIYYHNDIGGLRRGQWVNVKEEDGKLFGKWNFQGDDSWREITDVEEMPYHNFHGAKPSKTFTWGGWRHWLDDEVENFWDIEGERIRGDFEIPGMPHVKRNIVEESKFYQDEYERIDRSGTDEERLIAAISYMYGVDMDTAKRYISDLGTTQRNKALAYYDLRNLPVRVRLAKIREMYPPRRLKESSYGGAYDIADYQYFTVEDVYDAAEEVLEHIKETFYKEYMIGGSWLEDGKWIVNIQTADGMEEFEESVQIDMRKIRNPSDLKAKYALELSAKLIKAIKDSEYEELIPEGSTYAIKLSDGKYAVYIKDNYVGKYPRAIAKIKLKPWGDDVIIKEDMEHTDFKIGDEVFVIVSNRRGIVTKVFDDKVEVEMPSNGTYPARTDVFYKENVELLNDKNSIEHSWEKVASKNIYDSDGFLTDYTWYRDLNSDLHIFVFGDNDIYGPDIDYADFKTENMRVAADWYDNYEGFVDDEDDDLYEAVIHPDYKVKQFDDKPEAYEFARECKGSIESVMDDNHNWQHYVFYKDCITEEATADGDPVHISSSIEDLNAFCKGLGDACKHLSTEGDYCNYRGYEVEFIDDNYYVYLEEA